MIEILAGIAVFLGGAAVIVVCVGTAVLTVGWVIGVLRG